MALMALTNGYREYDVGKAKISGGCSRQGTVARYSVQLWIMHASGWRTRSSTFFAVGTTEHSYIEVMASTQIWQTSFWPSLQSYLPMLEASREGSWLVEKPSVHLSPGSEMEACSTTL